VAHDSHRVGQPDTIGIAARNAWVRFWFTPTDPAALHVVRVFAGLVFLTWLLPLAGDIDALFGLSGWFDREAYTEAARLAEGTPQPITWSILYLCGSNHVLLAVVYWLSIAVLALFTAGLWARLTGTLTWVIVASFTAPPALGADADPLLLILALYLAVGYALLGLRDRDQSLISRLLGSRDAFLFGRVLKDVPKRRSLGANLALRLLQVHFALVILTSGLHKLQIADWWAGLALWYPLHPLMEMTPESLGSAAQIRSSLAFLSLAAYAVLAWQIGFPAFAWRPRWRPLLLGGALIGWLGCAFVYRVPIFGPALFAVCLSYVSAEEWYRIFAFVRKIPGLKRISVRLPATAEPLIPQATR
jgi:hypothetical protein